MSYTTLLQEGLQFLEAMNGGRWTDFNAHDPGITLLEVFCYGLSDLAYRSGYSIPDLLASGTGDPTSGLFPPAEILTTRPVTTLDLRKLVVDISGVRNAWVEPVSGGSLALDYRAETRQMLQHAKPPTTVQVAPTGFYRVVIEPSGLPSVDSGALRRAAVERLQANRGLCEDFLEVRILQTEPVQIKARIEIGSVDDPEAVLLSVFQHLADAISPPVHFVSAAELLRAGTPVDTLFDGPRLGHGFLAGQTGLEERRSMLHTSDLLHTLMDLPTVRAVRSILLAAGGPDQAWRLPLDPSKAPKLDPRGSEIRLERAGAPVAVDTHGVIDTFHRLRAQALATSQTAPPSDGPVGGLAGPPAGRDRGVANYRSVQHDLPTLYGLGAAGLPASASPKRRAQARQLEAYLLFFDQLLADGFAQLAHAGQLFSATSDDLATYFGQVLDDPSLGLEPLWVGGRQGFATRHQELVTKSDSLDRKNGFLDHLLARFGECFAGSSFLEAEEGETHDTNQAKTRLANDKLAFLRQIPFLGSARGTAFDYLQPSTSYAIPIWDGGGRPPTDGSDHGVENVAGLAERLRLQLGLVAAEGEALVLIEHILLRPVEGDRAQRVPLLEACPLSDPYSLQLSIVLPTEAGRFVHASFRALTEQVARQETPAHLTPYVRWLDADSWASFRQDHDGWLEILRATRQQDFGLVPRGVETMALQEFWLRAARDRLIDRLGLGETYPIQNPQITTHLRVAFGVQGSIRIHPSQKDVVYSLRDEYGLVLDPALSGVPGTGGEIVLRTPPIQADITFTLLAHKTPTGREDYLVEPVTVEVGVDTELPARILTGVAGGNHTTLLDPSLANPTDSTPRLTDYGGPVKVQVDDSQEGVAYDLVTLDPFGNLIPSSAAGDAGHKMGNLHAIVLESLPMSDDLGLWVRCARTFEDGNKAQQTETQLLAVALPLAVRPNPRCQLAPREALAAEAAATVQIHDSQASVEYQLYWRLLEDRDFLYSPFTPEQQSQTVVVPGQTDVRMLDPRAGGDPTPLGFAPLGTAKPGNGGVLEWDLGTLPDDLVAVVEASKSHEGSPIVSSLLLDGFASFLLRPQTQPGLHLAIPVTAHGMPGTVRVEGGEPGVFYFFRRGADGAEQPPPAYFYQLDRPTLDGNWPSTHPEGVWPNKGLGKQRIEGDFVVARNPIPPEVAVGPDDHEPHGWAYVRPLSPVLKLNRQPLGTSLHVRAVKERTLLDVPLAKSASTPAIPTIRALASTVDAGSPATVRVSTSRTAETYQLFVGTTPFSDPKTGTGSDLDLVSHALNASTTLEVHLTRPSDTGIQVTRVFTMSITVRSTR